MSNPTTGEWTVEQRHDGAYLCFGSPDNNLSLDDRFIGVLITIADAHNSAIDVRQQHIDNLDKAIAAEREKHCKDCCCARSWEALGVTENTGKSIPEHIQQLREQLAAAQASIQRHNDQLDVDREINCTEIRLDTTALDAAIAAAQQPLRELLLEIRGLMPDSTMKDLKERIDALTK